MPEPHVPQARQPKTPLQLLLWLSCQDASPLEACDGPLLAALVEGDLARLHGRRASVSEAGWRALGRLARHTPTSPSNGAPPHAP